MIGLRYDLRVPEWAPTTPVANYAACLEQCRWADDHGLNMVTIAEHHGVDDGYLPAPLNMAAAIAAVTSTIRITISALVLPLHDPVRIAEQLAVVDIISQGRIAAVLATGYRDEEFAMVGLTFKERLGVFEEYVGVLRQAFTGEPFDWRGRTIRVTPKPYSPHGPLLMMGGSSEAAVRRAARLRLVFTAGDTNPRLQEWYADECAKTGFQHGLCVVPPPINFLHVTEDPERDWERIAPHALHEARSYGSWMRPGTHSAATPDKHDTIEDLRNSPQYMVLTPAETIELYRRQRALILHPLMGGMPPELGWESLELFADKVLPVLRAE